ncbi:chorismate synthase [Kineococcus rhizosphaerae]|uniref:Chorismate synthase n=1 Tax=Kineococcus rhizosphaerae TaxID=559628 RepID=A0A2T0R6H3_9ACTN|nr:chorismate synthase [Kineococcus rhizosphaerae]PRY16711.1 chorismate synthase [Kineococcus rhizosphaerae]
MLRWLTSGESHGPALAGILEGLPAGVEIDSAQIRRALARRRLGHGRGARMNFEQDELEVIGGVRHGLTQGGPIALRIGNTEWPRWSEVMAADPADADGRRYDEPGRIPARGRSAPLTRPRPGHADLTGMQKYGFTDARPVLERASARETATRVALGEVARAFLAQTVGAEVVSHVVSIGTQAVAEGTVPARGSLAAVDADPVRCADPEASARMVAEIDRAHTEGDTLGGVVEVVVHDLPPGLGSYVHWDRKLDARLAAVLMGIQAIKGVEVGDGFETARRRGSAAHDEIERVEDGTGGFTVRRRTDRAGGIEGGMTNGEVLRVRAAMKPISTVPRALDTIDTASGDAAQAIAQRSDVCAVPAAGVVAEAMVALVLADAVVEKFGGDNVEQVRANVRNYLDNLAVKVAETA